MTHVIPDILAALAKVDWDETRRIIRMARRMADADVMLTEPDSVASGRDGG